MGQPLFETIDDFSGGVNTSAAADALPPTACPRLRNGVFTEIGAGTASVEKRRGMSTMNTTAITGGGAVIGQLAFFKRSGIALTQYHLLVSDTGRLDVMATDGSLSNISTGLTAGTYYPDFAVANNLAFIVNGQDAKKTNGTSLYNFGIAAPGTAPTLAAGAAGNPNGTYQFRVTFYNGNTGQESSAGPTSLNQVVVNQQINLTAIPTSATDAQVTARRLYVRNVGTQTNFYFVATINDNVTTTYTYNLLDAALVTIGPDTVENNPPPSGITHVAYHKGRLFVTDGVSIYWSKADMIESFDPEATEPVNPSDGQIVTGLHSAHDILIIFKGRAMYGLYGDDPQSFVLRLIDPSIGTTAARSIQTVEGYTYFWSEQGPAVWDGGSNPRRIGLELIAASISKDAINYNALGGICAGVDTVNQRLIFAVPEVGQTKNTLCLPWNYRLTRWEGEWDPIDVASLGTAYDSTLQPWLFLGGYYGQVFKLWNADADGVPSGTTTGSFTPAATSITTITDAGAAFFTTGTALKDRKVTILDANNRMVGSSRSRISSNTGTVLTLASAVAGLQIGQAYTYIVGGPDFQYDTPWLSFDQPFFKKRFEFLYVNSAPSTTSATTYVEVGFAYNTSASTLRTLTLSSTANTPWDEAVWDSSVWGGTAATTVQSRLRMGRTGRNWRVRLRNPYANQGFALVRLAMQAELLTGKS